MRPIPNPMKASQFRPFVSTLVIFSATTLLAQDGWLNLFNGKNLDGWEEHSGRAKYTVTDGVLTGESVAGSGNSFLCTRRSFENFEFELEYRCDALLNSGVHIRREVFPDATNAVIGGKDDHLLGEIIATANPSRCLNLCGSTTLLEMVEWLRLADLLVTNDTGPMHVAAALDKPLIALFGPTEPRRTGPYGQSENVLRLEQLPCVPCMKSVCHFENMEECLRAISPAAVFNRVAEKIS